MHQERTRHVLVYRLGSIGDIVVSLPCLHLIRRRFPDAKIVLLTNQPVESRAAPAASILDGTGLVDKYISYPIGTRHFHVLSDLKNTIGEFGPDLLIYLVSRPTSLLVLRDYLFFRLAGVKHSMGFPFLRDQRACRPPSMAGGLWEPEANRLARCIKELGPADMSRAESWDLHLSRKEMDAAGRMLGLNDMGRGPPPRFLGLSIGTKQPQKDWGDANWRRVLMGLRDPGIGLILIGSKEDRAHSAEVAKGWPGPVINLCGTASLRESAAAMRHMEFFLCHDSGPMHLAASVNTHCVALFSKKNKPGQWFPFGAGHTIIYPPPGAKSIRAIEPAEIVKAVAPLLAQRRVAAESPA